MARKTISRAGYALLLAGLALLLAGTVLAAGNIDATNRYAWSTNAGWINFNPANGGVTVYSDHLEGWAWGENIGWIRLGTHTGGSPHTYANDAAGTYGVNNDGAGNLSGYAWSKNVGWISFNPTNGGVTIDPATGDFDGYAWSENVGWISFQNDSPAYKVNTDWRDEPTLIELASFTATVRDGGILLYWETASELDTLGFNLYRNEAGDGPSAPGARQRLNEAVIPAQGQAGLGGGSYSWLDGTAVPGVAYDYWLEEVDVHGGAATYGPVRAGLRNLAIQPKGLHNGMISSEIGPQP